MENLNIRSIAAILSKKYLLALLISTLLFVAIGWFTDIRNTFYTALMTGLTVAFLPFVIIACGIALVMFCMIVSLFLAILGGEGSTVITDAGLVELGARAIPPYYRFLSRIKHPVFWAILSAMFLASLILWSIISFLILPGEIKTAEQLIAIQVQIEDFYRKNYSYPKPGPNNTISRKSLELSDDNEPLRDGFGLPFEYSKNGIGPVAEYRVLSIGFDRKSSKDDFCIHGMTKLAKWRDRLSPFIDLATGKTKKLSFTIKLGAVNALRCDDNMAETKEHLHKE